MSAMAWGYLIAGVLIATAVVLWLVSTAIKIPRPHVFVSASGNATRVINTADRQKFRTRQLSLRFYSAVAGLFGALLLLVLLIIR